MSAGALEAATFDANGAHQGEPGVPFIRRGGEVQVDVLGIEGLANQWHVVLPADGGGEVDSRAPNGGGYGTEGRR